jgi:hypothetical protein
VILPGDFGTPAELERRVRLGADALMHATDTIRLVMPPVFYLYIDLAVFCSRSVEHCFHVETKK